MTLIAQQIVTLNQAMKNLRPITERKEEKIEQPRKNNKQSSQRKKEQFN